MVSAGATVTEPSPATVPTPLSMLTDVAFEVLHVSVAVSPTMMVHGSGSNESMATEAGGGTDPPASTVTLYVGPPYSLPPSVTVSPPAKLFA